MHSNCRPYLSFELLFRCDPHPPSLVEIPADEDGAGQKKNVLHDSRNYFARVVRDHILAEVIIVDQAITLRRKSRGKPFGINEP